MTRRRLALGLGLLVALAVGAYHATAQPARHYYLSPWVHDGTRLRPAGTVQGTPGWAALAFWTDRAAGQGRAILSLPARNDGAGRTYLGTNLDAARADVKAALAAELGIPTLRATTLRGIIAELYLQHGRTDGTRWRPLRGQTIYLGDQIYGGEPRVWLRPVGSLWALLRPRVAWADYFTETWACADNAALTCVLTWTELQPDWTLTGGRARFAGNLGLDYARVDHDTISDDQRVWANLATWTFVSNELGVSLACRKDGTATLTAYDWGPFQDNSPVDNSHYLQEMTAGVAATLANPADDATAGSALMITCEGSTIKGFIDGVEKASATDTSITGNLRGYIVGLSANAGNVVELDDFRMEDYFHYPYRERGPGRGLGRGMK